MQNIFLCYCFWMNDYHCHRKFSNKWKMINSIWRSTYTRTRLPKKKNTHVRGKQMFTISSLKKKMFTISIKKIQIKWNWLKCPLSKTNSNEYKMFFCQNQVRVSLLTYSFIFLGGSKLTAPYILLVHSSR